METPLRFQPEQVPRAHSLAIGNLVFHSLNGAEVFFGSVTLIGLFCGVWNRLSWTISITLLMLLAFQTWILFAILDDRTMAKIRGEEIPDSLWHSIYIGSEGLKVALLLVLIVLQIRQYRRNVIEHAQLGK